jgi:hypothetical protein
MMRIACRCLLFGWLLCISVALFSQVIRNEYIDLPVPGQWQTANNYSTGVPGTEVYYDVKGGSLVQIRALSGMQKVAEISKYFQHPSQAASGDASQVLFSVAFPLPDSYAQRAAKDVAKGVKPPRLWEMKEGDGNPTWFYTSQLFGQYDIKNIHGGSEVEEEFNPVRVTRAEHKSLPGGEALLLELETDHPPSDAALKRFHMPSGMKDQKVRFSWIQYAPGGITAAQGVLSVIAATGANSDLTSDELLTQIGSAKLKPME